MARGFFNHREHRGHRGFCVGADWVTRCHSLRCRPSRQTARHSRQTPYIVISAKAGIHECWPKMAAFTESHGFRFRGNDAGMTVGGGGRGLGGGFEAVAYVPDGFDEGAAGGFYFGAEAAYVDVDGAGAAEVVVAPDLA